MTLPWTSDHRIVLTMDFVHYGRKGQRILSEILFRVLTFWLRWVSDLNFHCKHIGIREKSQLQIPTHWPFTTISMRSNKIITIFLFIYYSVHFHDRCHDCWLITLTKTKLARYVLSLHFSIIAVVILSWYLSFSILHTQKCIFISVWFHQEIPLHFIQILFCTSKFQ